MSKTKRSLYFTKTFFFSSLLYLSVIYSPIVNSVYDKKISKDDLTAIVIGTFSFLGISNGRLRVNEDIRQSAEQGTPVGLLTSSLVKSKEK